MWIIGRGVSNIICVYSVYIYVSVYIHVYTYVYRQMRIHKQHIHVYRSSASCIYIAVCYFCSNFMHKLEQIHKNSPLSCCETTFMAMCPGWEVSNYKNKFETLLGICISWSEPGELRTNIQLHGIYS